MLRVSTIYAAAAASAAAYYTKYLTEAPGEAPGVWVGTQATELGLAGRVDGADLLALLEGRDPVTGTRLGRPLVDRKLANGPAVPAVAGFDATFSAPKSLSVLWALTQDDRLLDSHDLAVNAVLAHLERYGATTRVRSQGRRLHPDARGLTMATFRQTTSRADDPQLHTHVVISAKVQTDTGRWLALDARYLKQHQRMLGGLYQSVLRNELTHRFGIAWHAIEHGQAEMTAVPAVLRDLFSKRTEQVDQAVADKRVDFVTRQGREPNRWELAAIKREAAADTRCKKSGSAVAELATRWQDEAATIGWTGRNLAAAVSAASVPRAPAAVPPTLSVDDVVAALSTGGSTWNRAQVVAAVCDEAPANSQLDGRRWAEVIEGVADQVIARCVELDPADATGPRRMSDQRSMWLEPTSTHLTTDAVLREEELVLSWALDAQADEPTPSTTVDRTGLDILQADAADAVAGRDELVLIVGPAGTGKTTTLRAAARDLDRTHRPTFGVAPSAKAARVLERETGIPSDTLAKLLHEWERSNRPPDAPYRLPAGTTIIVDEAGMVSTPALARLIALAGRRDWRVALVGDPHQLQAVGRGGLFHELCASGRVHELQRIHRFDNGWEGPASLMLRRGDPRGWDTYIDHDRVVPGSFDEHVATAAQRWLDAANAGATVAVVASTNEHVDALNQAVQQARIDHGQLHEGAGTQVGGGHEARIGDHVVTRRNDRRITTTEGQPVRNRELWSVTTVEPDGSLVVSSIRGHGSAHLPADYVRDHVHLGYAATEHGVQGDTTTIGMTLISGSTSRRGAYVGLTRGRQENVVLVVTDSHDIAEARDLLDRTITLDRADVPATTQRRELAAALDPPVRHNPPRCQVPDWLQSLRSNLTNQLADARRRANEIEQRQQSLADQMATAERARAAAEEQLAVHRPSLDAAAAGVRAAEAQCWSAHNSVRASKGLRSRSAARLARDADADLTTAQQREAEVRAVAGPAQGEVAKAYGQVQSLRSRITATAILNGWDDAPARAVELSAVLMALDDWQHWADGDPMPLHRISAMVNRLRSGIAAEQTFCTALATAVEQWAETSRVDLRVTPVQQTLSPAAPSLEIDL